MFGVIMPLCNRMFCCIFGWHFYIEISLKHEENNLLSSSRAFSLSTSSFLFSTPVENSEATWKKATKWNKELFHYQIKVKNFFFAILLYYICNYIVQPNVEQMWRGTIYQEVATEETNDWHHQATTKHSAVFLPFWMHLIT